jgi:predicted metal-dependent HD superfamily phosphohydrolase
MAQMSTGEFDEESDVSYETSMSSITGLEKAWSFANRWWLADPLKAAEGFAQVVGVMEARGGYHSVSHIERMVDRYGQWCNVVVREPDARLLAWIFAHDLVYTPGAPNNEEESANRMESLLQEMGASRRILRDDRLAIESTKTHEQVAKEELEEPTLSEAIQLLHDLDLEILGSSRGEYEEYGAAVYAEYFSVSDDPLSFHQRWLEGRSAFLKAMLGREVIFKTPLFSMFDAHARDNMRDELEKILDEMGKTGG